MIFQDYEQLGQNVLQSLKDMVPIDLGIDFTKAWSIIDPMAQGSKPIVSFQTILSVEIVDDSNVANTVIEDGSFVSYNKVERPSQIQISLILEGLQDQQQKDLETLRSFKASTVNVTVVTPFESYPNMNITGIRVNRTSDQGASQTFVDIILQEIREVTVQTARMTRSSQTKNVSAVSNQKNGKVSATTLTSTEKTGVQGILKNVGIGFDL